MVIYYQREGFVTNVTHGNTVLFLGLGGGFNNSLSYIFYFYFFCICVLFHSEILKQKISKPVNKNTSFIIAL